MGLPVAKNQVDKLGKRLCSPTEVAAEDWALLESILDAYQVTLDQVQAVLEDLGYAPTSRVKSTGTLIDKLRRGSAFSRIADVAGAASWSREAATLRMTP